MSKPLKVLIAASLILLTVLGLASKPLPLLPTQQLPTPHPQLDTSADEIRRFAEEAVARSQPKLSQGRITVIVSLMVNVAMQTFDRQDHRMFWIALLGVESRYDGKAKSHAGAVGIGQLIPSYRADFGKGCGITDVSAADLADDYTNATLSACYFRTLIRDSQFNVPLAMVMYNSGAFSQSTKNVKQGKAPVHETAAYVTKIVVEKAEIKRAAEDNQGN